MKLFFRHFGHGNPIIILHGLFGISDNWVTIGKQLAEHAEVFIPDLRNHGQSPHSPVFTIPALVEDLLEFTEDLNLKNVILIGHSLGGLTSMHFTLQYPHLVNKLIVVDISLRKHYDYKDQLRLLNAMQEVDFSGVTKRSDIEIQLRKNVGSAKLRNFLLKNVYWRDKQNLDWRLNITALYDNLPLILGNEADGAKFGGPVLFVRGGLSDHILDEDHVEMYKRFPLALIKTIPGASHWVHADAPVEFNKIVSGFLM